MVAWNGVNAGHALCGLLLLVYVWLPFERRRTPRRQTYITSGLAVSFVLQGWGAMLPADSRLRRTIFVVNWVVLGIVIGLLLAGRTHPTSSTP